MARRKSETTGSSDDTGNIVNVNTRSIERNPGEPITIDPATIGGDDGTGSSGNDSAGTGTDKSGDAPKRRGRPRGSTNRANGKTDQKIDISSLEVLLFSTHQMLAAVTKTPEFAIEESEAKQLATAAANVARHYDMGATQKTLDWSNLIQCLALIYGSRIYAVRVRKKQEKEDEVIVTSPQFSVVN